MELTLELAEKILAAQPFSVLLGARVTAFGDGGATLELDIRPDLQQQNGFLHGGVLGYAADNAITFAGGSALGPEVLTGGFTIGPVFFHAYGIMYVLAVAAAIAIFRFNLGMLTVLGGSCAAGIALRLAGLI